MGYDLTGLPDDTAEQVEKDLARLAELEAEQPAPDPITEADPQVQAHIEKQAGELAELRKELDAQRAARELAEFVNVAKTHPAFTAEDDEGHRTAGQHLANLAGADRDSLEWLLSKVAELEKIAAASDLFKNLGVNDPGDAATQIEALAKEKMAANPGMKPYEARAQVRTERPDLKSAEREEKAGV